MTDTLLRNVRVIDGSGAAPFAAEVLVSGNRIKALARRPATLAAAPDAVVVDGGGATLMPGLVEAHAHPSFINTPSSPALGEVPPEEHTLLTAKFAGLLLDHGFTALHSAASAKPRLDVVVRNAINAGDIVGPRMLAASLEMTVTSGLGDVRLNHLHRETFAVVADGPEEFRRWARFFVREGVDILKINPSGDEGTPGSKAHMTVMTDAEVAAVAEVAVAHEKRMAAHARSAGAVKMCLRHGVDVIYHATLCDEEALDMLEAAKDRVFVAPTIGITWSAYKEAPVRGVALPDAVKRRFDNELVRGIDNMKALHRRGVRVLPGGDYGFAFNPMPRNARDMEHFVTLFGFTPMEAIVAATRLGGELMAAGAGPGETERGAVELGQVKEDFLADLLLVDGDPSIDVTILQDPARLVAIMKDGIFHKAPTPQRQARPLAAE
ncbi:amidohydrolase family protein [Reyranella sp.]|uniref:amidohydrolase family protein n=1 Tax=Reyranella sp. TaxID=1929291 RepID=UPI003D12CFDC